MSPEEILEIRARRVGKMAQKLRLIPDTIPHPELRAELSRREIVGTCAQCTDGIACHRFTSDTSVVEAVPAFCQNSVLFETLVARFGASASAAAEPELSGFALWAAGLSMSGGPGPQEAWFCPPADAAAAACPATAPQAEAGAGAPPDDSAAETSDQS